jgi:hypothetical protein
MLELTRRMIHPVCALLLLLSASPMARAIAIFPAKLQNNTSVAVEICVVRVQTQLGSPATTNEVKVTIQPGESASVMLMGGTFGTGASYTKQITISQAANFDASLDGQLAGKPIAPPLVLDKPTSTMAREFVVDVDRKTGRFTFEAVAIKKDGN